MDMAQTRRARLRAWIDEHCNGSQSQFVELTGINQGELSALLRNKSFGEKKARNLESLARMPIGWLDQKTAEPMESNVEPAPDVRGSVPLISWVQAGHWGEVVDNFAPGDAEEWLPCFKKMGPHSFALRVRGVSMEPKYQDGDIIFVDPDVPAEHGKNVVVRLNDDNEATFKQLVIEGDHMFLKPLNPDWPGPKLIQIDSEAQICGVVVGKWVSE